MTAITDFLEARITEDEATASRSEDDPNVVGIEDEFKYARLTISTHRVRVECAAKRATIRIALTHMSMDDCEYGCSHNADQIREGRCKYENPDEDELLRTAARIYANHEDYREEWKP